MKRWNKIVINRTNKITKINKVKDFKDFCDEDEEKLGNEEGGYKSTDIIKIKIFF